MNGFVLRQTAGVPYYTCAALERDPGLRHGFSTRCGGVSPAPEGALNLGHVAWDASANVTENRRRFLSALNLAPECLATVAQIHSAEFHIIKTRAHQWNPRNRGDALITSEKGVALAVQVADCFPVLISDPIAGIIAAVHAGWRGTLARILRRTLEGMRDHLGAEPARAVAAIGPGIRACCLEVGSDVASSFESAFPGVHLCSPRTKKPGKYLLDLLQALKIQLSEAGVPGENVFDLGQCTRCHPQEFFSYRADGARAGRMMGVICRVAQAG
ncbi:MAG: peptidoglycan editing factor PgeF [Acidobacteriia bacterium]|nr:peptidoglycan editing factor PgeF [Terriglobia bacterium]